MEILREKDSSKIFAITLDDDSIIFIPSDQDPEEKSIEITLDQTEIGVPITRVVISPIKWLRLNKRVYQELTKAGWKPAAASQFLPRGA